MPASPSEVDEAQKEGVKIQFLIEPLRITMIDGRANVECIRTQLTEEIDPSGRKKPIQLPGTEFSVVADTVIVAAGQVCILPPGFNSIATGNFVQADPNTMSTSQVGIFAAGAAIRGGSSVIEAISAGIRAASCIARYLGDKIEIQARFVMTELEPVQSELQGIPPSRRVNIPKIPISERLKDFSPIELELKEEQAVEEARRCLGCDLPIVIEPDSCVGCLTCVLRCASRLHDRVDEEKSKIRVLPMLERANALIFREGCEVCGICARYCPHGALYRQRKYFGS
jgi:NAD-dependent dihydropyrimidine dehydrogenase PreA subunit